jgi:hypothetical protein
MFESRKELFTKIEAQAADITRLETELSASQAKVTEATNETETVAGLTEDLEAAKTENKDLSDKLVKLEADHKAALEAEQAKTSPEAIQALVTAELVKSGHPALSIESKDEKGTSQKKDFSHLNGRDRVSAAIAAQFSK